MKHHRLGTPRHALAGCSIIGGLLPAAIYFFNHSAHFLTKEQGAETYFTTNMLKLLIWAIPGVGVAFILLRLGSNLKPRGRSDIT